MNTTSVGKQAEIVAAEYLRDKNYRIISANWKTPLCEIDIVAEKDRRIYFVEVKYRRSNVAGSGFDYITATKKRQMVFATQLWMQQNDWHGDSSLAALEVTGDTMRVSGFVVDV